MTDTTDTTDTTETTGPAESDAIRFAETLSADARAIITEEVGILKRLRTHLAGYTPSWRDVDYDESLLELRDSLGEASEDEVAQIVQQMANLASLSAHHREQGGVEASPDPESPYFGHLRIHQNGRTRELLIGNRTLASSELPYAIIDWRHAPISKVFYLYRENDEYEEAIGGRMVEGRILAHRRLMILKGRLVRIVCPQGVFMLDSGGWREAVVHRPGLSGGEGASMRPGSLAPLGEDSPSLGRTDRRLSTITGLIDPAQFDLITRPDSGVVVIDGGAGSGKTTIALHRIAYLAYRDPERFQSRAMLVVVFGRALANYIASLLPALGVEGVRVEVFEDLLHELRRRHFPELEVGYDEATPATVIRFKQHPALLALLRERIAARGVEIGHELTKTAAEPEARQRVAKAWEALGELPLGRRLQAFDRWVRGKEPVPGQGGFGGDWLARQRLTNHLRDSYGAELERPRLLAQGLWREALLDLARLSKAMGRLAPGEFSAGQLTEVRDWAFRLYAAMEDHATLRRQRKEQGGGENGGAGGRASRMGAREKEAMAKPEIPLIDREDDTLLLLLHTLTVGPLLSRRKRPMRFQHLLVDEAQDLGPLDLRVLIGMAAQPHSITLAGDTDQRMIIHDAFNRWEDVLEHLELESTAISPLQVGYRSTAQIMDFAKAVLGPLATGRPWIATREGAPVSLLRFTDAGQAVATLSEELLQLMRREPAANVVLISRHPSRADLYYEGLLQADLPGLRRVADQDFTFT
ncbi:MAG: UvrD-helicase domain-containing protein, partial [bacterium]